MMKKHILIIFTIFFFLFTTGFSSCSKENLLAKGYPEKVKALFIGVERAVLKGSFSKGGLKRVVELFKTTDFQKHKALVIENVNVKKGAFAETEIFSEKILSLYKTKPETKQIFNFYTIEGLNFKKVPYLLDVPAGKIDRSFKSIKNDLKSNLVIEVRPVELEYNESGNDKWFELKVKVMLFDLQQRAIVWSKEIFVKNDVTKPFYKEAKLKQGESPTPGFKKIKVEFFIENYKKEIAKLADKVAPEVVKLFLR